ncbi:hypothetical protein DICVIV_07386 [Dictyocaulus viviparus]|uniref:ZMIZ1 N-terminal domain-containing protein n=1 Tax=Dictyocaulus viviparus TaxID=29172 RepID=A0A0D8XPS3_DICVI|nr:hypothetical protein DICVIV_07386 [Dictyocaulus viviparus]
MRSVEFNPIVRDEKKGREGVSNKSNGPHLPDPLSAAYTIALGKTNMERLQKYEDETSRDKSFSDGDSKIEGMDRDLFEDKAKMFAFPYVQLSVFFMIERPDIRLTLKICLVAVILMEYDMALNQARLPTLDRPPQRTVACATCDVAMTDDISYEEHVQQNNQRLISIKTLHIVDRFDVIKERNRDVVVDRLEANPESQPKSLMEENSFPSACAELTQWCGDQRAFSSYFEENLLAALQVAVENGMKEGFDFTLAHQLISACFTHRKLLSKGSANGTKGNEASDKQNIIHFEKIAIIPVTVVGDLSVAHEES